jgi:hypothetical protein
MDCPWDIPANEASLLYHEEMLNIRQQTLENPGEPRYLFLMPVLYL